ncbi:MAG: ABC transporter substrate-binding protein [Bacteroidaceae bacterium]|nr:ABC transporter substrate-binding protein [Bacteroidaceae bacterium]
MFTTILDTLSYAQLLHIERADSFVWVTVGHPWRQGEVLQSYVLVPKSAPLPFYKPQGRVVRTPLSRSIMHNAVHAYLTTLLSVDSCVVGVCDTPYLQSQVLKSRLSSSLWKDAGSSVQSNVERYIALGTDAVFVSPLEDVGVGALAHSQIPMVVCADYMEPTPLGRAEWMKFFGLLFDCESRSDSLFKVVESSYKRLQNQIQNTSKRPKLLLDLPMGVNWYVPGGRSSVAQLFQDAGADYVFADVDASGSVSYALEHVMKQGRDADFWLVKCAQPMPLTYSQLADENKLYTTFRAWKERCIYACNTLHNDYYESVPFQPHLLLNDLVHLFYSSDKPDTIQFKYFNPIVD